MNGTKPDTETREPRDGRRGLCVRWVHPTTRTTQLRASTRWGRDPTADVHLHGERVSWSHAEVEALGPILMIRDVGSRNGLYVDGQRVTEASLDEGTILRLGEWVGLVQPQINDGEQGAVQSYGEGLLGGPGMSALVRLAREAATSQMPVVIEGETGTGKEVFARFIHRESKRSGSFVAINCAALHPSTIHSELFGHRRGAFTGAEADSPGVFRSAQQGTILLDEIVDFPLPLQATLLRVLQEKEVHPLGQPRPVKVDFRVLAAAQCSLRERVERGEFRDDLAARLSGWTIRLPLLRERLDEIPSLLAHKISGHLRRPAPRFSSGFVERLLIYPWPLNLRELDMLAQRLATRVRDDQSLGIDDFPGDFARGDPRSHESSPRLKQSDDKLSPSSRTSSHRREHRFLRAFPPEEVGRLQNFLDQYQGNLSKAAAAMGITRTRAYRLLNSIRGRGKQSDAGRT